jgi:Helix-turn-helix domain
MHRPRLRIQPLTALQQSVDPPAFLTPKESAAFLRLSDVTLARWRIEGIGPPYRKFGRRVLYARADLVLWADGQTQQNTSQYCGHLGTRERSTP